jgi:hypothetical protein
MFTSQKKESLMDDSEFKNFVLTTWKELQKKHHTEEEIKYLQYVARLELAQNKFKKDLDSEEE